MHFKQATDVIIAVPVCLALNLVLVGAIYGSAELKTTLNIDIDIIQTETIKQMPL